ncbi:hypothetical protein [Algibacter sp. 2305UL17-15]|uniref:hypothetical protein n=1 Tax=Algibacter sp. 2305UL17-15 TaxID=3231268 RepID=UPI003457548F
MKKIILMFALLFTIATVITSCRDDKKSPEDKIEAAIEDIEIEAKENSEEVSDDVENALEDVENEIKEAKEEVKKNK